MVQAPEGPRCPFCGYPVRNYWRYCPCCGSRLFFGSEAVSARNQPQGEGKVFPARTYPAQNVLQY